MRPPASAIPPRARMGWRCVRPPRRNACRPAFMSGPTAANISRECNGHSCPVPCCCGRLRYSGALMSTFTGRELEFLAGLNKSWWTLYGRELARLRRAEGAASDARQDVDAASPRSKGLIQRLAARIPAFAPDLRGCEEAAFPVPRRQGTEADRGARLH